MRPFTRPREVITFQTAELPGVAYDAEFHCLAEARRFFGVPTGSQQRAEERGREVYRLRESGLTQAQTAEALGVSVRTVRNYERKEGRQNPM